MISCPSLFSCKGFQAIEYAFPFPAPYQGRFSPAPVNGATSNSKIAIDRAKLDILQNVYTYLSGVIKIPL